MPSVPDRPSVLLISTDDQNVSDLRWMPRTRRLLGTQGMRFTQALSPHPLCCPARAEMLTGQYAQNNGVQHNRGRYGGFHRLDTNHAIATWLQDAGYRTAFTGKFLNGYDARSPRPPGWTIWDPAVKAIYAYWGTRFRQPRPRDDVSYNVSAISDRTVDYLRRFARDDAPFFLWASHIAPHAAAARRHTWVAPAIEAPYQHMFERAQAPALAKPSFSTHGQADDTCVCDRTRWTRAGVQEFHRQRLRSLQSIDVAVARALRVLAETGREKNTYVFFCSDNGLLMGEHGIFGKNVLYDEALRVPLLARGPGIQPGSTSALPVTLTDLAPTILDLAGGKADLPQDGQSFLATLHGRPQAWRNTQVVQTGTIHKQHRTLGWGYRGVRTARFTYGLNAGTGQELLLDRVRDPFETRNRARDPAYDKVIAELRKRTASLIDCAGAACNGPFGRVPRPR